MESATNRKTYLDSLRILACIGVIFNHVIGSSVTESAVPVTYWTLFDYFICKTAVPLFLMISGTLLLSRVDSYRKIWWRIVRIGLALTFAFTINYAYYCIETGEAFDVGKLVLSIYRDRLGVTYSYWYLYRYLSLLVMLPILQRMMTRLTRRDTLYFLFFSIIICGNLYATTFFYTWVRPNAWLMMLLATFSIYIGMLLLGYYLDRCEVRGKGSIAVACVGALLFNGLAAYLFYRLQQVNVEEAWYLDRCDRTSVVLAAGCIFYAIKQIDARIRLTERVRAWISRIGRLTFAVYLVSELLIDTLTFIRTWLNGFLPVFCADRVYVLVVFAAGLMIAELLTRIPLLKKIL